MVGCLVLVASLPPPVVAGGVVVLLAGAGYRYGRGRRASRW
ncbi:hypothetical protein [Georgenia satyanarayanai]|nr:hypothetical protein [Georgenia satyanarayanai]